MKNAIFNWSGGKDSAIALYRILKDNEFAVKYLITTFGPDKITQMHRIPVDLIEKQAASLGMQLLKLELPENPTDTAYTRQMKEVFNSLKQEDIHFTIYGDIFLEDVRRYREDRARESKMNAVFPIWQVSSKELMEGFIDDGFKAKVICINPKKLDESFLGREIDREFLADLPGDVDPAGENGEFHTFVYDGPIFKYPVNFGFGEMERIDYAKGANAEYDSEFVYKPVVSSK